MHNEENSKWIADLKIELDKLEERFVKIKDRWNFWYYISLYGAIILSAFSALIIKSELIVSAPAKSDLAALSATLAAILGTAMTAGSFENRWRSARIARNSIQLLKIDIAKPNPDLNKINDGIKNVLKSYSERVVWKDELPCAENPS